MSYSQRYLQVMAYPSSRKGNIAPIQIQLRFLRHLTGYPSSHKACTPRDSNQEHQCPKLMPILTQIYRNDMETDQIYPTDVGTRQIISPPCCSSPLRRRNQYQLTRSPTKYLQQMSRLPKSSSFLEHLRRQTLSPLPNFTYRRRGQTNFLQLPPRLLEILPTYSRAFEPEAMTPPGMYKIPPPRWSSDTLVGSSSQLYP